MTHSHSEKGQAMEEHQAEIVPLSPDQIRSQQDHDEANNWLALREIGAGSIDQAERLAEFYVATTRDLNAEERALDEFYERRKASILRRRNALEGRHGSVFTEALKSLTKGGKGKFYDTPAGRAGFRKSKVVVTWDKPDEQSVIEFLEMHLPQFVKAKTRYEVEKTGLLEALEAWAKEKGGLPVCIRIVGGSDKMYVED